jgi:hypothetical protein
MHDRSDYRLRYCESSTCSYADAGLWPKNKRRRYAHSSMLFLAQPTLDTITLVIPCICIFHFNLRRLPGGSVAVACAGLVGLAGTQLCSVLASWVAASVVSVRDEESEDREDLRGQGASMEKEKNWRSARWPVVRLDVELTFASDVVADPPDLPSVSVFASAPVALFSAFLSPSASSSTASV